MSTLSNQLILDSCPHCGRANPTLVLEQQFFQTKNHGGINERWWGVYCCKTCGGIVSAWAPKRDNNPSRLPIQEVCPSTPTISDEIPEKARELLRQAQNSLHAPAGAIMLCASAVDAMLKEKEYTDGTLNDRINKAAQDHLITDAMAEWAHYIRLDANEQRHADVSATLPNVKDAKLTFDFAIAFAEYLFVLPSRVTSGITDATAT